MDERLAFFVLTLLLAGCLGQSQPTPTPSPTPVNNPPIADFSFSWTGGDKDQPWTCSKITFDAKVSDPEGDSVTLYWYDNGIRIPNALGEPEFSTKLWPDGMHTIKLMVLDSRGGQTIVEKQIDVKYEVPEPVPVKNKNGLKIATIYVPIDLEPQTHQPYTWLISPYRPVLGYYNMTDPVTIDWHIKLALEHGISIFWIWIAPHSNPPEKVFEGSWMTYYREGFSKAKYMDKIKFNVFLDARTYNPYTPGWFESTDSIEKDAEILSTYYFNQENYYRIKGKPVVYMALSDSYYCDDCKDSKEKKEREELLISHIKLLRETAKKYGYDIFLIGDLTRPFNEGNGIEEFLIESFDALTSYNMESARNPKKYQWKTDEKGRRMLIAPYDELVTTAIVREKELSALAKTKGKTYIPFVEQGYNDEKRLNVGRTQIINRTNPTTNKYLEFIDGVKPLIDPKLNILLTTWNEFSEGNGIEPTKEFGFAYLDIIRDNFAIKPPGGWPLNIVPTKNCGCAEYKGWSTEIGMPQTSENAKAEENEFLRQFLDEMKRSFLFIVPSNFHYTLLH
jgi:hypothetical protein